MYLSDFIAEKSNNHFDKLVFKFAATVAAELRQDHRHLHYQDSTWNQHRFGTVDALWHQGCDTLITLTAQRPGLTRAFIEGQIYAWKCRVNRLALGRNWARHKDHQLKGAVFFECFAGYEHAHLVVKLPPGITHQEIKEIWGRLVDRGDCQVDPVWDCDGLLTYVTKQTWWGNESSAWKFVEEVAAPQA